jgi:glycosyltransferase involved in cell wall biosynthesis
MEMAQTFLRMKREYPDIMKDWRFLLVGGSDETNPYLRTLEEFVVQNPGQNIHLKINIPIEELRTLYQEATLFWHLCGLTHRDPSEIEHFGMTTVEAMQNKAVPIVYDGGGLREIVDHGVDGFRVNSKAELSHLTLVLCRDNSLVQKMSESARAKSRAFSRSRFDGRVRDIFSKLLLAYKNPA